MAQRNESSFKSYKKYIKDQGELDNFVESRELAFRFYVDTVKENNHFNHEEMEDKYGIHCAPFNIISGKPYGLYVLLVYHSLDSFFYRFIEEHPKLSPRRSCSDKEDKSMFNHLVGYATDWKQDEKRLMYYNVYHYYRGYRNDYSHQNSSVSEQKLYNTCVPHKYVIRREFHMGLPNMYRDLNFNDFLLFSRIAKQIAKELCLLMELTLDELVCMVEKDDAITRKRSAIISKPIPVQRKILINTIHSQLSLNIETAKNIVDELIVENE